MRPSADSAAMEVLDALGEGVTIHAPDGLAVEANRAAEKILRLDQEELTSRNYRSSAWEITDLEGRPLSPDELPAARAIEEGQVVRDAQIVVARPDADPVVLSVNAVPLGEGTPPEWAAVVTFRDVTERSRLERDLRRREQRYERLMTEISDVVTLLDGEGTILYESPSVRRAFGWDPDELVGRRVLELVHPADEGEVSRAFYAAVEGRPGPGRTVQYRFRHADGSWRLVESSAVVPGGEAPGPVIVTRDITDRVRAQQKFQAIFSTVPSAVALTSLETGEFVEVNEAFEELLGYRREETLGRTVEEVGVWVRPEERQRIRDRIREEGSAHNQEATLRDADGQRHQVLFSASLLELGGETFAVGIAQDITERKEFEEALERQALHDPLTGLPNRSLLADRLEQGVARAKREGEALGLLMLDIDDFKRINDRLGHTAGDRVLVEFARRLEGTLREEDTLARWGGDEFFVVLPRLDEPGEIVEVPERLREAVRPPFEAGEETVHLGITVGAVVYSAADRPQAVGTDDPEELIRYGSLALHGARERGRGSFELFDPGAEVEGASLIRQERELREALERGEIVPHFQPIVRLSDGSLVGIEALARWNHPDRGLLPPAEFIPLAEEMGMIGELGEAVVRQGCRQAARWSYDGAAGRPIWISFNLSGQQFGDAALAGKLDRWVREGGLAPERVTLEVTETSLMQMPRTLTDLREAGFRVFVDDFGTGYSTFAYLRNLQVDGLKIDMSFVQSLLESASDEALVETMLTLGARLELDVVAEGIETEHQRRKLREIGCERGQGFLFARPVSAEEMAERLNGGAGREG